MNLWPFSSSLSLPFSTRRKSTPTRLQQLEEVNRNLQHQVMIERLDQHRKLNERVLTEDTAYAPPFELVNPWAQFYDGFKLLFPLFPARFDYRYSQNYIYLTQGQLDLFRSYARYLYETVPYADGALNSLADYTISTGFSYYCQPRKYARNVSPDLVRLCNQHLENVLNANCWWLLEREFFIRPKRDGDAFLRFFPQDDGITKLRAIEPEQIRYPLKDADPEWSFGIQTDPDDKVTHLAYQIWYSADHPEGETVPAQYMIMFKNRMDLNVKRGIGDFFNVQDIIQDADKLLRAGRQGEAVRQSIAYIRQWALANSTTISTLQAQNTDFQLPKYNMPAQQTIGSFPLENVTNIQPGEVHDVPKEMEFQNPPIGSGQNLDIALQATLRAAAVKWRVPEWVLTGQTSTNFAASLVAESPMVKAREWEQKVYIQKYIEVCERILDIASAQGILPEDVCSQVQVCAEGVPIAARNLKDETEICSILYQNGILSKRTWSAREELDFEEEQENRKNDGDLPLTQPQPQPTSLGSLGSGSGSGGTPERSPSPASPGASPTPGAEYQRLAPRPE